MSRLEPRVHRAAAAELHPDVHDLRRTARRVRVTHKKVLYYYHVSPTHPRSEAAELHPDVHDLRRTATEGAGDIHIKVVLYYPHVTPTHPRLEAAELHHLRRKPSREGACTATNQKCVMSLLTAGRDRPRTCASTNEP